MAESKFWNSAQMEPKRSNKFVLRMQGVKHFVIKSVKRPSPEVNESKHDYFNYEFKFPGKVSWSDVDLTLVEPISHNSVEKVREILAASGYKLMREGYNFRNNGSIDRETFSKAKSTAALGTVEIEHVDADDNIIDAWELHNPWVKGADFSELNYEEDGLSNITLTLSYDWASVRMSGEGFEGQFQII